MTAGGASRSPGGLPGILGAAAVILLGTVAGNFLPGGTHGVPLAIPVAGIALALLHMRGRSATLPLALAFCVAYLVSRGAPPAPGELSGGLTLAAAATFQALGAAAILERIAGRRSRFDEFAQIAGLFAASGFGATVGTGLLAVGNLLLAGGPAATGEFVDFYARHWAANFVGMIIGFPLAIPFLGVPGPAWRGRRLAVLLPTLMAIGLAALVFQRIGSLRIEAAMRSFHDRAEQYAGAVQERFEQREYALHEVAGRLQAEAGRGQLNRDRFLQAALAMRARFPEIVELGWAERVADGRSFRVAFATSGGLFPAIGTDLLARRDTRASLLEATESEGVVITELDPAAGRTEDRLLVVQAPRGGVLGGVLRGEGFLVGVVGLESSRFALRFEDLQAGRTVYRQSLEDAYPGAVPYAANFTFAGHQFRLSLQPTTQSLVASRGLEDAAVLLVGLVVAGLVGAIAMLGSGHAARVQMLVKERTHELALEIEERRTAQFQLVEARDAAESASRAKSRFLATMSHEIRTPLNGILGMGQLLLVPDLPETERHEFASTIVHSGQTLLALLNDILDLSRVEAGRMEIHRAPMAPQRVLRDVEALFAQSANAKGLRLEASWEGEAPPWILGDSVRLHQMLSNLVGNAIKFSEKGTISILGRLVAAGDGQTLELSVRDEGIGIAPEKQARLFEAFTQADESDTRRHDGSGLGLSIVRSLAYLMQGDTGLVSAPGRGTHVWFRVPAPLAPPPAAPAVTPPALPAAAPASASDASRYYVLVVEDNPVNRKVIEGLLRRGGHCFETVVNGREAVDHVTSGAAPELILMDCQMPVMDGFAATAGIREWERERGVPRVPIIALTASAFESDRYRCLEVGMDEVLTKPVSAARLNETIEKWCRTPVAG